MSMASDRRIPPEGRPGSRSPPPSNDALLPAGDVAASKLGVYATGHQRKSKLEKEREAALLKQQQAEQDAARAYEDFLASFDVDGDGHDDHGGPRQRASARAGGKSFVRAGASSATGSATLYNPLKDAQEARKVAPSSAPATPLGSAVPTAPRAMRQPPLPPPAATPAATSVSAFMEDDDVSNACPYVELQSASKVDLESGEQDESAATRAPVGRKKRDMDNFLEQLKREQREREDRLKRHADRGKLLAIWLDFRFNGWNFAREHAPVVTGSYDSGDPTTTNIHVAPLPENVNEQSLGLFFAEYGPVGSVKIMWPRVDNIPFTARGGSRHLGGFVAFLRRPDAEKAMQELEGAEWGGNVLRLGWGKAVPLPARPIYEVEGASSRSARARDRRRRSRSFDRDRSRSPSPRRRRRRSSYSDDSRSRSRSPRPRSPPRRAWPQLESGVEEHFIKSIVSRIREHGRAFEDMLRDREKTNPKFAFFRDSKLPSYHYFRMLLDSRYEAPPATTFADEGQAGVYSSDSDEDSERESMAKGRLGRLAQTRFESLLRCLTSTREKIARGMAFALEHADSAQLIADLLVCSLTIEETPVPRKLARLHLVSDILHNSSTSLPNAWVYRSIFESKLPEVFDHLGDIYNSFPGRMKAEQFKGQISKVIDVWEHDWMIFEPATIEDWRRRLSGADEQAMNEVEEQVAAAEAWLNEQEEVRAQVHLTAEANEPEQPAASGARGGFKTTFQPGGFKTAFHPSTQDVDDVDGEAVDGQAIDGDGVDGQAFDGDGVDGQAVDDNVDGAPATELDGEEVDGVSIEDGDIDGAAIEDEDVDGEAVGIAETVVLPSDSSDVMDEGNSDQEDMFGK
ncbi:hypothetical protein OIO90_003613 [Microbotryomycetes sp. JL221]|nr:hypothetical protein OIO90_003613 [Microbotryomycetes sp. JL221]